MMLSVNMAENDYYMLSNWTNELQENNINVTFIEQLQESNDSYPSDLRFNENSLTVVIVYSVLFLIAAVGNSTVFFSLFRSRHRKSRISLMIRHLAIADLVVTFIMIPLEVSNKKRVCSKNVGETFSLVESYAIKGNLNNNFLR